MRRNNLFYFAAIILLLIISLLFNSSYRELSRIEELNNRTYSVYNSFHQIRMLVNTAALNSLAFKENTIPLTGIKIFTIDTQSVIRQLDTLKAILKDPVNIQIAGQLDSIINTQLAWLFKRSTADSISLHQSSAHLLAVQKIESLIAQGIKRTAFLLEYGKVEMDDAIHIVKLLIIVFIVLASLLIIYPAYHLKWKRSGTIDKQGDLENPNRLLTNTIQIAGVGMWKHNIGTSELYWSDEMYTIWEIKKNAEPITYTRFFESIYPEDKVVFTREQAAAMSEQRDTDIEYRIVLPNGLAKWIQQKAKPIMDTTGKLLALEGTVHDINLRRCTELELMRNEFRYRSLFENSPTGILLTDDDENVLAANTAACKFFNMTEAEICSVGRTGLIAESNSSAVGFTLTRQLKEKEIVELRLMRKGGETFPAEVSSSLFTDSFGQKKACINIWNITERKLTEGKIARTNQLYFFISQISRMVIRTKDEASLFKEACRIAVEIGNFKMAWIGILDPQTKKLNPVAANGAADDYLHKIKAIAAAGLSGDSGLTGLGWEEEDYYICNNIKNELAMAPWKELALSNGFRSFMNLPIRKQGQVVGLFAFYTPDVNFFDANNISLLREAVNEVSFGMETIENELQRRKAEVEILKEKNLSDSIINSLPGVFYLFNKGGKLLRWNRSLETTTRFSKAEISGMHPLDFFDGSDRTSVEQNISNIFTTGEDNVFASFVLKTNEKIPFYFKGIAIRFQGDACVIVAGVDVSESVAAQEKIKNSTDQLRRLAMHLQTIREEERKKIGREIHDELGQQLTAINMDIAWVNKKIPDESTLIKDKLKNALHLLNGTNQSIRRILSELRPAILDDHGLLEAIAWLGRQFTENTGVPVKFSIAEAEIKSSEDVANCIFRACQEAFTNITRYAKASEVFIALSKPADKIVVIIEDDGIGFNLQAVQDGKSFGILGMRERVASLGGQFELTSVPGRGTQINFWLPANN